MWPRIPPYPMFTNFTPTLPAIYWDVDSQEERIKKICLELHKLVEYANQLGVDINLTHDAVDELNAQFEQFKESGFFDYYEQQVHDWIYANLDGILTDYIKSVFFGLTPDGYFCAWIPHTWDEIGFDTISDYSDILYGRLVLLYDAEGNFDYQYGDGQTDVTSYESLSFKPSINGTTLISNLSFEDLGLTPITSEEIQEIVG